MRSSRMQALVSRVTGFGLVTHSKKREIFVVFGVFILRFVFFDCKNINLVLKYLVFYEMLQKNYILKNKKKKIFYFHAYGQVS